MKRVTSIDPVVGADGKVVYLSTAGVAEQVMSKAQAAGEPLGTVGVIGFADHVVRCVLTARAAGMTGAVPKGVEAPERLRPAVVAVVDHEPRVVPRHRPDRPAHDPLIRRRRCRGRPRRACGR